MVVCGCSTPVHPTFIRIIYLSVFSLDSANRRYEEVAREALNESAITAIDPFKQVAISFFDNKAASLVPLKALYFLA